MQDMSSRSTGIDASEWYTAYFREQYRDAIQPLLTPARTAAEVEFILRATGVRAPARVADVACGDGRHSLQLAARGFEVTGIDFNADFIASAREAMPRDASAQFIVADMRDAMGGPYDLILFLFQAFGFFDDATNQRLLHAWARRLAPGGCLVIDILNRDAIVRRREHERTWQPDEHLRVTDRYQFDPLTGRLDLQTSYIYTEGRMHEHDAHLRLYAPTELRDLFAHQGIDLEAAYGSLIGDPFTLDAPRLVAIGRKLRAQLKLPLAPSAHAETHTTSTAEA